MARVAIDQADIDALAVKVRELNEEITRFYGNYGNGVRVTGHCNFRRDEDDPYFTVHVDVSEVISRMS